MKNNFTLLVSPQKLLICLILCLNLASFVSAQTNEKPKPLPYFAGTVGVNNNGISIVPSFSLGKPAVQFILTMGKNRFSIDPDLRFSLAGKPWSFLFWGRYQWIRREKFKFSTGAHLGLNYKTSVFPINGDTSAYTVARRYLAGEFFPRFALTKKITVGTYYLYSHGLDAGTIRNTHFITLFTHFSNLNLSKKYFLSLSPQLYYLKLDQNDGYYLTSSFTIGRKNFPLSISAILNKVIKTHIAGKNLVWNVSLVYSFHKNYTESK